MTVPTSDATALAGVEQPAEPLPVETSVRAWPRWPAWVRVAIVPVLMLAGALTPVLVQLPLLLIPGAAPYMNDPKNLTVAVPIMLVGYVLPTVFALVAVRLLMTRVEGRRLRDAGVVWTGRSFPLLCVGLVVSLVVILGAAVALQPYARPYEPNSLPVWATVVMAVAAGVLMQGFPEELLFRGYLMQTLRKRPMLALTLSVVIFGALHFLSNGGQQNLGERLLYLTNAAAFAFCAGALALLCRSLWPAVGIHAGLHLATLVAALMGISSEGPVLWAVTLGGYVLVGAVALVLRSRREGLGAPVVYDR